MRHLSLAAGLMAAILAAGPARAALTQVGDFRLPVNVQATGLVAYDTFSFSTRAATTFSAPLVGVVSTFSGTSQNAADGVANLTDTSGANRDLQLQANFTTSTNINTLNRFASTTTAGAVQWSFSLANLANQLKTSNLKIDQAQIGLATTDSDTAYYYDVYLSYTSAADGLTKTSISSDPTANYSTFFKDGNAAAVNSKVDGKFVVLAKNVNSAMNTTFDLSSLYAAGVTDFNLIFVAASSYGSNKTITVGAGSGVFVSTTALPEPATLGMLGMGGLVMLRRKRA